MADDILDQELFGGDVEDEPLLGATQPDFLLLGTNLHNSPQTSTVVPPAQLQLPAPDNPLLKQPQPQPQQPAAELDIELDDPPGELTLLNYPPRPRSRPSHQLDARSAYEVTPSMLFVCPYQIHCTVATSNMRWLFTGGEDGYVRKWDFNASVNGRQQLTLGQRHSLVDTITNAGVLASYWDHNDQINGADVLSPVYSMAAHSEGMWVLSGMKSGGIALWSVRHDEGRRVELLRKHKKPVSALSLSPDEMGAVSGGWDRAVLYWDLNTGKIAREFSGHSSQISSAAFQPTTETTPLLMTSSIDGQCLLWDLRAPAPLLRRFEAPPKTPPWAAAACWSSDGRRVLIGRRNHSIDEYDISMAKATRSLRLPVNSGAVTALAALPNNRHLVCASADNLRIWDLQVQETEGRRSAVPFQVVPGHHGGGISSVFVDESGRYMVTPSGNRGWGDTTASSNLMCLGYTIN